VTENAGVVVARYPDKFESRIGPSGVESHEDEGTTFDDAENADVVTRLPGRFILGTRGLSGCSGWLGSREDEGTTFDDAENADVVMRLPGKFELGTGGGLSGCSGWLGSRKDEGATFNVV